MSDFDGQNLRHFRSRGSGITRMADSAGGSPGIPSAHPSAASRPIRRLNAPSTQPFPIVPPGLTVEVADHVDDLIAGYALGALEADERMAVDRHAAFCPDCARQLAGMRSTATMLPFAVAPAAPSPDVRAALFSRIAQSTAPVGVDEAADYQWARPISPRPQVTLPSSRAASGPIAAPVATARTPRRRSPVRMLGIATPVLMTFGLLALFLVPQIMPDGNGDSAGLAEFLGGGAASCGAAGVTSLVGAEGISACGQYVPDPGATSANAVGTLYIGDLQDVTPDQNYDVSIPMIDGGYELVGSVRIDQGSGHVTFARPDGFDTDGQFCVTGVGEDPNVACVPAPAA